MTEWIDVPRSPGRQAVGKRHSWTRGVKRDCHRCAVCGLERMTERGKDQGAIGMPRIPRAFYRRGLEPWRATRPPCEPQAQTRLFDTATSLPIVAVRNERIAAPMPKAAPKQKQAAEHSAPRPVSSARVVQHEVGVFPPGVSVILTITDPEEIFASEYDWTLFVHREPGIPPTPKVEPVKLECSIHVLTRRAKALCDTLEPRKGLWVVARRSDGKVWAWNADGQRWQQKERKMMP